MVAPTSGRRPKGLDRGVGHTVMQGLVARSITKNRRHLRVAPQRADGLIRDRGRRVGSHPQDQRNAFQRIWRQRLSATLAIRDHASPRYGTPEALNRRNDHPPVREVKRGPSRSNRRTPPREEAWNFVRCSKLKPLTRQMHDRFRSYKRVTLAHGSDGRRGPPSALPQFLQVAGKAAGLSPAAGGESVRCGVKNSRKHSEDQDNTEGSEEAHRHPGELVAAEPPRTCPPAEKAGQYYQQDDAKGVHGRAGGSSSTITPEMQYALQP